MKKWEAGVGSTIQRKQELGRPRLPRKKRNIGAAALDDS